jgi:hypothetical protein
MVLKKFSGSGQVVRIALGGVAGLTKTTLLKNIKIRQPHYEVHMSDYKEFFDQFHPDPIVGNLLYVAWRKENGLQTGLHYYDRLALEGVIYNIIRYEVRDEVRIRRIFQTCKELLVSENWQSLVLIPTKGSENAVVEMMKRRNNGIDIMTLDYVNRQTELFKMWAEEFQFPTFEIDVRADIEKQHVQLEEILENMKNVMFNVNENFLMYRCGVDKIRRKHVAIDFLSTSMINFGHETNDVDKLIWDADARGATTIVFVNLDDFGEESIKFMMKIADYINPKRNLLKNGLLVCAWRSNDSTSFVKMWNHIMHISNPGPKPFKLAFIGDNNKLKGYFDFLHLLQLNVGDTQATFNKIEIF